MHLNFRDSNRLIPYSFRFVFLIPFVALSDLVVFYKLSALLVLKILSSRASGALSGGVAIFLFGINCLIGTLNSNPRIGRSCGLVTNNQSPTLCSSFASLVTFVVVIFPTHFVATWCFLRDLIPYFVFFLCVLGDHRGYHSPPDSDFLCGRNRTRTYDLLCVRMVGSQNYSKNSIFISLLALKQAIFIIFCHFRVTYITRENSDCTRIAHESGM